MKTFSDNVGRTWELVVDPFDVKRIEARLKYNLLDVRLQDELLAPWLQNPVRIRKADKFHLTGKPTELLRELVQVVPPGSRILDPFAGSGTTLVAAQELGRLADGIEREREYCEITRGRLQPVRPADAPRRSAPNARSLAV